MTEIFIATGPGQKILSYNRNYQKYEQEIKYYKELCKWHVQQKSK